jgi:galactonate dehydratase
MHRRQFVKFSVLGSAAALSGFSFRRAGETSKLKITKIRYYNAPGYIKPLFNQARGIVEIETDGGLIGIGEGGGSKDMISQCAEMLIGEDPFRIDHLWQKVYRGLFYPPGREKLHAMGALDMALWDIKGQALNVPVYELLGGASRDFVECYATGYAPSKGKTEGERARDCIEAGFRVYRIGPTGGDGETPFDFYENVDKTIELCRMVSDAVGRGGKWAIDLHTRFEMPDAIRICSEIAAMEPYFVEDLIRSENPGVYKTLRPMVKVPIAVGEQFGDKWDVNELIENQLIDYTRVTLPNTGGITEFMKIAALCETHYVGMIPHFTGPLATAALVHALGAWEGRAIMELAGGTPERPPYFNEDLVNFKNGRLYLNNKPGLGVKFNPGKAEFVTEIKERNQFKHPLLARPDGSVNNW